MKILISACAFAAFALVPISGAHAEEVAVDTLLKEVKSALLLVQQSPTSKDLPKLQSVTLNLTGVQKKQTDGTFKLFVIELGAKTSKQLSTSLTLTLAPPPKDSGKSVSTLQIDTALASAILSAGTAISNAQKGSPPLIATEVKANFKFAVTQDKNGAITLKIAPLEGELGGGSEASSVQEITVLYKD